MSQALSGGDGRYLSFDPSEFRAADPGTVANGVYTRQRSLHQRIPPRHVSTQLRAIRMRAPQESAELSGRGEAVADHDRIGCHRLLCTANRPPRPVELCDQRLLYLTIASRFHHRPADSIGHTGGT